MKHLLVSALFTVLLITLLSCNKNSDGENSDLTTTINARTFSVQTPNGWHLVERQGYDSYVGNIKNNNMTINFDQGFWSFSDLSDISENHGTEYLDHLSINVPTPNCQFVSKLLQLNIR